MNFIFFKCVLQ